MTILLVPLALSSAYAIEGNSGNVSQTDSDVSSMNMTDSDVSSMNITENIVKSDYNYEPYVTYKGSYRDIQHSNDLQLSNFSVLVWFKTSNNYLEPGFIVNKGGMNIDEEGQNMNYGIWITENNTIEGGFENITGDNFFISSDKTYNDGDWHHAAIVYDGNVLKLFVDGIKISENMTNDVIPDINSTKSLRIAANSFEPDKKFIGSIDEIRIWNRGIDDSEIKTAYESNEFDTTGQIIYIPNNFK
ncbi:MAG: LamG domain-containing protein [Nitrososphaeraceae archaeon]